MADKPRGYFIAYRDWQDFAALLRWWRHGRGAGGEEWPKSRRGQSVWIGIAAQSFEVGPLNTGSDPHEHSVSVRNLPTDHPDSKSLAVTLYPDYANAAIDADQPVFMTRSTGGGLTVSPYILRQVEVKVGKPDADIAKGASGTVSVWDGEPGSEADTGEDETGFAKAGGVTAGKFVILTRLAGKTGWYVDCWEHD